MNIAPHSVKIVNEEESRAKVFYLLKKFTSLTFVQYSVGLYRSFLHAYEVQLDAPNPNQKWLEETYRVSFLGRLAELEHGEEMLGKGIGREAAFVALSMGNRFVDYLWGMSAEWWGVEHDPFFVRLGRREPEDTGVVASALLAVANITLSLCTALPSGRWTYDTIFDDYRRPPARRYPANLLPCPSKNMSSQAEVPSDEVITTDGIWEPWFTTGKVGCPNYFIKGQIAHKYQPEETTDRELVRWRLLWEDTRYVDGTIPGEEADYLDKPAEAAPVLLKRMPGDICPRTGYWEAFAMRRPPVRVISGEPMPGPEYTDFGVVIWNYVSETGKTTHS